MSDLICWLIGIVLALAGVGLGMFYQGKVLLTPEEGKKRIIGKQLYLTGQVLIVIAFVYLIVVIVLQLRA